MKWFRIRGKTVVINTQKNGIMFEQSVNVVYQTASNEIWDGSRGYVIRPPVPYDKASKKTNWLLFYPINSDKNPSHFNTLKEARAAAEIDHQIQIEQ